ncbi:MAG: hypothetical protein ABWX89_08030, partial [Paeniglutamicibacter terrestris]
MKVIHNLAAKFDTRRVLNYLNIDADLVSIDERVERQISALKCRADDVVSSGHPAASAAWVGEITEPISPGKRAVPRVICARWKVAGDLPL